MKLQNYVEGQWVEGKGDGVELHDPVTGDVIAYAGSEGVDMNAALSYARQQGSPALQAMTYGERASLLNTAVDVLMANRDKYVEAALMNSGNTSVDAMIDVDGGIGTLKYFAGLGSTLGDARYIAEPGMERLSREKEFQAIHVLTPLKGVAIHINAFNFPSWGLWEKAAVSLLAGVPVFVKPATTSSLVTYQMIKDIVEANIFPAGSLSLICGGGHDLMNYVQTGDVVLFTGSAKTAEKLSTHPQVVKSRVRFNVEADSVNMSLLGGDASAGSPIFDAFIKEVTKEMTTKAGQKCTAIRRIMVPQALLKDVSAALVSRLGKVTVGDPREEGVRMGPLMNKAQQQAAWDGIEILKQETEVLYGDNQNFTPVTNDLDAACFVQPTLLLCNKPLEGERIHDTEVFGPVATLMPYTDESEAWELARRGGGSLVCSVFSNDEGFAVKSIRHLSSCHGRVLLVNETVISGHSGHGIVMPQCVHGGPGRAGGGEELGGLRGLRTYHQRTAIQGDIALLDKVNEAAIQL